MESIKKRNAVWFLKNHLLAGFVCCATTVWVNPSYAEEDYPSILFPAAENTETENDEGQSLPSFSSSVQPREESIKRPAFLTEQPRPPLVNPQQLIYERAAREARAREARITAKKWYGISSSRPSVGSNRFALYAPGFGGYVIGFPYSYPAYYYYPGFSVYGARNPFGL